MPDPYALQKARMEYDMHSKEALETLEGVVHHGSLGAAGDLLLAVYVEEPDGSVRGVAVVGLREAPACDDATEQERSEIIDATIGEVGELPCPHYADEQHRFGETGPERFRTFTTCRCGALKWRAAPVEDPNQPEPPAPQPNKGSAK